MTTGRSCWDADLHRAIDGAHSTDEDSGIFLSDKSERNSGSTTCSASPLTTTSTQLKARIIASPIGPSQLAPPNTIFKSGRRCFSIFESTSDATVWPKVVVK